MALSSYTRPSLIWEDSDAVPQKVSAEGGHACAEKIRQRPPPIDDPVDPADHVLTLFQTGEDFGWSGTGTFTHTDATDLLNRPVLPAPPNSFAIHYAQVLLHAKRLDDSNDTSSLGARFVDSFIETDCFAVD